MNAEAPKQKKRGRPRKARTQTPAERAEYLRQYNQRPEVIEARRARARQYEKRLRAEETPEEREERLAYRRMMEHIRLEAMTEAEREERREKRRLAQRERRARARAKRQIKKP